MSSDFDMMVHGSGGGHEPADDISYGFTDENVCGESKACTVYCMRLMGLRVAVKRLKPDYRTDPLYVSAFRKEFKIGLQLKHDGLPVYRGLRNDADEVYIIMDYVDGLTLADFIATDAGKDYFSSADNVRRFLTELLDVTAYLHRSGVIHCDIKPTNIKLRHSDRGVMLLDLDKAYSDTLDRTHGGTKGISDLLPDKETPTAVKDYRAIGRIIEILSDKVPDFPESRFKNFRKKCDSESPDADRLKQTLKTNKGFKIGVTVALMSVLATASVLLWLWPVRHEEDLNVPVNSAVLQRDTVIAVVKEDKNEAQPFVAPQVTAPAKESGHRPDFAISPQDIDKRFQSVMEDIDKGFRKIRSGKMAAEQMNEMVQEICREYTAVNNEIRDLYRTRNPELSALELENALINAYEKSRIQGIYLLFLKEYSDTVDMRIKTGYLL